MFAPQLARRSAIALLISFCTAVAVIATSSPAQADQHQADGAVVRATNSFAVDGGAEEVFIGPSSSVIRSGNEFTGFGGFDIDIRSTGIFMQWSTDPQFDDFEGEFEGGFRDFFSFEFDDASFDNVLVDSTANLVPGVLVSGNTIRVTFSDGMVYGDGQLAIIRADITRDSSNSGTGTGGGVVISRQIATESAPTINPDGGIAPANPWRVPNPVVADGTPPPSVPNSQNVATPDVPTPNPAIPNVPTPNVADQNVADQSDTTPTAGEQLAVTGATTNLLASASIVAIVAGAAVVTTSRRPVSTQVRRRIDL